MKKSKGFTLIEIVLVMVIGSVIFFAFGRLLIGMYSFSNRALDQNNKMENYLNFRIQLDSQLRNAKSRYILLTDASAAVTDQNMIKRLFSDYSSPAWWAGSGGNATKPRVSRAFAFYFFDEKSRRDVRIEYRFNRPSGSTIANPKPANLICSVWENVDITKDVADVSYVSNATSNNASYSEVVLGNVIDFMATTHRKPAGGSDGMDTQDIWTVATPRVNASDVILYINMEMGQGAVSYVREITFVNRTVRTPYKIGT